jgi:hypothetical protein
MKNEEQERQFVKVWYSTVLPTKFIYGTIRIPRTFYIRYSTLLDLPPLRFHCIVGRWDQTQDSYDYGIGCQTL